MSTDSSGDAVLATTGKAGSCVGLISPGAYSSAVIEAYIYFPPLPGKPDTIADWTSVWLTNQATWPVDGELDAASALSLEKHFEECAACRGAYQRELELSSAIRLGAQRLST